MWRGCTPWGSVPRRWSAPPSPSTGTKAIRTRSAATSSPCARSSRASSTSCAPISGSTATPPSCRTVSSRGSPWPACYAMPPPTCRCRRASTICPSLIAPWRPTWRRWPPSCWIMAALPRRCRPPCLFPARSSRWSGRGISWRTGEASTTCRWMWPRRWGPTWWSRWISAPSCAPRNPSSQGSPWSISSPPTWPRWARRSRRRCWGPTTYC